jgi:hypothetical protein
MKTNYDTAATWFLHQITYRESLRVIIAEGIQSDQSEDIQLGKMNLGEGYALTVEQNSRRFSIEFSLPIAWQVVDESYTTHESYEAGDRGFLRKLTQSHYFDYINQHHRLYKELVGPASHYRVWTENEVIDVIAQDDPVIQPWTQTTDNSR